MLHDLLGTIEEKPMPFAVRRLIVNAALALTLMCLSIGAASAEHFPRPAGLEPDIAFWTDIYTQVETNGGVLHDARVLSVRYETIQFPENISSRARSRLVKKKKQQYEKILRSLGRGKRQGLSAEQARVLAFWPADVSNKVLGQAAKRVRFQLGQADRFKQGLVRSGVYKAFIKASLQERGLPEELAALPHVESSFNPTAYSKVGAAGMWQFTRSTGRRYMRIDHVVDERRDPFLSTVAAARLLESNYATTGTWPLALTGYNHGVSGMRRAARQRGTKDIEDIVRNYKSRTFGFASRNFYVAFLAALQIDQNPEQYFGKLSLHKPGSHVVVKSEDYLDATALVAELGLSQAEFGRLNPALLPTIWQGSKHIPKGFTLRFSATAVDGEPQLMLARLDTSMRFSEQLPDVTHRVGRGETLSGIAAQYRLRVADVVAINGLRSRNRIRAGQLLRLPTKQQGSGVTMAQAAQSEPDSPELVASVEPVVVAVVETIPDLAIVDVKPDVNLAADGTEAYIEVSEVSPPSGAGLALTQAALAADPADYSIADDGTIEIQALETLGHYGDWLELKTQRLRDLNGYKFKQPVVVGKRLKLDHSKVNRLTFEARRVAYHYAVQEAFFVRYRVRETRKHTIRRGESLWVLAQRTYRVPIWLLRQHNPDLDLQRIRPGMNVDFPLLEQVGEPT
jgi:membrane-bound lytic murein transglycosylase D